MDIKALIDNAILKPFVTAEEVEKFVVESEEKGIYAVCVNPYHVKLAKSVSNGRIVICSVVGFPLGSTPKEVKIHEAVRSVYEGAQEIDMVMNISAFKSGDHRYVEEEIKAIVRETGKPVKVIIETCYLSKEEKITATRLVADSGAHFVKTSTGFGSGGSTLEDVKLLKETAKGGVKVKASGGIRDLETALSMVKAGADRIGTSNGVEIARQQRDQDIRY